MRPIADQASSDFDRIEQAICYLREHFKDQPSLEEVARQAGLSPAHFQRLFTAWAGTSPKQFSRYLNLEYAKTLLKEDRLSLLRTSNKTGLSSTGRLHDLFVTIEGMTPGEYKNGGASLTISYDFAETPFGRAVVASTAKGICYLAFAKTDAEAIADLRARFPRASLTHASDPLHADALAIFSRDGGDLKQIKLHLKGTDFQLNVWRALLTIPEGRLTTYGGLATRLKNPKACRAVGSAVGDNPVSFLIPCHRVIQSTGIFGNYRWGAERKATMIGWEGVKTHPSEQVADGS